MIESKFPEWFLRPDTERMGHSLYPTGLMISFAIFDYLPEDIERWRQRGWIGETWAEGQQSAQIAHYGFLADLCRAGLSDAQIERLLGELPAGVFLDRDKVAYSFTHGWVMPTFLEPVPISAEEALERLAEDENWEELARLRDRIDATLREVEEA